MIVKQYRYQYLHLNKVQITMDKLLLSLRHFDLNPAHVYCSLSILTEVPLGVYSLLFNSEMTCLQVPAVTLLSYWPCNIQTMSSQNQIQSYTITIGKHEHLSK